MKLAIHDSKTGGNLVLITEETDLGNMYFKRDREKKHFTIAWNKGATQTVNIDGTNYDFATGTLLPLMFNQSFSFEQPEAIVAWQFNREFYCIVDNDAEVSCVGFLFGIGDIMFINLDDTATTRLRLLMEIFIQELKTNDHIQNDMVVMLLKRLIIFVTKLARLKYIPDEKLQDNRLDIFRKFNLMVEGNFREEHSVAYYAGLLNKSPKTLSNIFALYNDKTPQQIIQFRIVLEAKRLLYYTTKSVKQITYELGFEDPAYFSNFFKRHTKLSPVEFRSDKQVLELG